MNEIKSLLLLPLFFFPGILRVCERNETLITITRIIIIYYFIFFQLPQPEDEVMYHITNVWKLTRLHPIQFLHTILKLPGHNL